MASKISRSAGTGVDAARPECPRAGPGRSEPRCGVARAPETPEAREALPARGGGEARLHEARQEGAGVARFIPALWVRAHSTTPYRTVALAGSSGGSRQLPVGGGRRQSTTCCAARRAVACPSRPAGPMGWPREHDFHGLANASPDAGLEAPTASECVSAPEKSKACVLHGGAPHRRRATRGPRAARRCSRAAISRSRVHESYRLHASRWVGEGDAWTRGIVGWAWTGPSAAATS